MSKSHTREQRSVAGTTCAEPEARLAAALDRAGLQACLIPLVAGPHLIAHGVEPRLARALDRFESAVEAFGTTLRG